VANSANRSTVRLQIDQLEGGRKDKKRV